MSKSASGYVVENVPFFVRGLSLGDSVDVRLEDGVLELTGVTRRGGHSTYRVLLADGYSIWNAAVLALARQIERLGCSFERATHRLLAIDVPSGADPRAVCEILEQGKRSGMWEFEAVHDAGSG